MAKVRVRLAPSPTGSPHLATAYQAVFNKAFANKNKGTFILRLEDTDRKRYVPGADQEIFASLRWLGLEWDEGPNVGGPYQPYRQSERLKLYQKYAQLLIDKGAAYYCFCSPSRIDGVRKSLLKAGKPPMYDRHCRSLSQEEVAARIKKGDHYTVRLKVPLKGKTTFLDLIRGKITVNNPTIDDQVLLKSDGFPTYHLAVVVDDFLMKITHIIRSEEWLSSVPKHVLIYQALGWPVPIMAHTPLIRDEKGRKLGKRHGSAALSWYRTEGFVPEAIINYLALLGWSHPQEKDIFDFSEFVDTFTLERIRPTAPTFDLKKLEWMNGHYMQIIAKGKLANYLEPFSPPGMDKKLLKATIPLVSERMKRLTEFAPLTEFFTQKITPSPKDLVPKKISTSDVISVLKLTAQTIAALPPKLFTATNIEEKIRALVENKGWPKAAAFMTIRVAVTGKTITPPLFESIQLLGQEKCLKRLQQAIKLLS